MRTMEQQQWLEERRALLEKAEWTKPASQAEQWSQEDLDRLRHWVPEWRKDCIRFQQVVRERLGLEIGLVEAFLIWREHSDIYSASWLMHEPDDFLVALEFYVERSQREPEGYVWPGK